MKVTEMLLEAGCYKESAFVTLTYDDEHLPANASLSKRDVQLFFKRMRKAGFSLRYVCCGEYGENGGRPHYHCVFYGFSPCLKGKTYVSRKTNSCCSVCDAVGREWGLGKVQIAAADEGAYPYLAKYILKDTPGENEILAASGRARPFYVKSQYLGNSILPELCLAADHGKYVAKVGDVPHAVKAGGSFRPLPPRLKKITRLVLLGSESAPPVVFEKMAQEISAIGQYARSVSKSVPVVVSELGKQLEDRLAHKKKLQASARLKFKGFK